MKIIVIVNKERIFRLCYHGIKKEDLIRIDNTSGQFNNFSDAVESIVDKIPDDETCIIAHQDVIIYDLIEKLGGFSIEDKNLYGVAGAIPKGRNIMIVASLIDKSPTKRMTVPVKPTEVENLDECVIVIKGRTLKENISKIEKSWHLYAVELGIILKNSGGQVIVLPCDIIHLSSGRLDGDYVKTAARLLDKYHFDQIYTTCGIWNKKTLKRTARHVK